MMKPLALVAFLFLSLPLLAQTHNDLQVRLGPAVVRVDPGQTAKFDVQVNNFYLLPPGMIRLRYTVGSGATIESVAADELWTCSVSGSTAECTTPALYESCLCGGLLSLTVRAPEGRAGSMATVTATISSDVADEMPDSNTASVRLETYRVLPVTTAADAGPGSFRNVIEEANASCGDQPCKIVFEIPAPVPAEGWFTILPATPLPPITASRVHVDASAQTRFTGDTNSRGPEIAIDGRLAHQGLEIHSPCERIIDGLALGNFDANQGLWMGQRGTCTHSGADRTEVTRSYIGVSPTGNAAWPNLRGLRLDETSALVRDNVISGNTYSGIWMWRGAASITGNRIGTTADGTLPMPNGASGMLLGTKAVAGVADNTIAFNREMGIAIARGTLDIAIGGNRMRGNGGLGIDWGLDGVSPTDGDDRNAATNAPVLLAARYDEAAQQTVVTYSLRTADLISSNTNVSLFFYSNDGPDAEGENPLGTVSVTDRTGGVAEARLPLDLRGKWLTATANRYHFIAAKSPRGEGLGSGDTSNTSEMSNAVQVQ